MNLMYTVTNLTYPGQVGGEIITPGEADIWGRKQDKKTLISFPHAPQPWNFPSAARFLLTVDQTNPGFLLLIYSHTAHPSSLCLKCRGNTISLYLLVCISCLLSLECIKCQWQSGLARHSCKSTAKGKRRGSPLPIKFALQLLPYRGSHDLTFLLSNSFSAIAHLLCCSRLLPVLYLKTTSSSSPVNTSEMEYTLIKCNPSCTVTWGDRQAAAYSR